MPDLGIGEGSEGSSVLFLNDNETDASGPWTMTEDGNVESVSWFLDVGNTTTDVRFGVMNNFAGGEDWPDDPLIDDATAENITQQEDWVTLSVTSTAVSNNDKLWHGISAAGTGGLLEGRYTAASRDVFNTSDGSFAGGLGDFGDPPSYPNGNETDVDGSAYLTYTTGPAPQYHRHHIGFV